MRAAAAVAQGGGGEEIGKDDGKAAEKGGDEESDDGGNDGTDHGALSVLHPSLLGTVIAVAVEVFAAAAAVATVLVSSQLVYVGEISYVEGGGSSGLGLLCAAVAAAVRARCRSGAWP